MKTKGESTLQPNLLAKKIRENLLSQKEKLQKYLTVLETEETDIKSQDADKLIKHIEAEKNIIDELNSFKKILDPLEAIYSNSPYKKDSAIAELKNGIKNLSTQVSIKSEKNKEILDTVIKEIKLNIKNKQKLNVGVNSYKKVESHYIDING